MEGSLSLVSIQSLASAVCYVVFIVYRSPSESPKDDSQATINQHFYKHTSQAVASCTNQ